MPLYQKHFWPSADFLMGISKSIQVLEAYDIQFISLNYRQLSERTTYQIKDSISHLNLIVSFRIYSINEPMKTAKHLHRMTSASSTSTDLTLSMTGAST